MLKLVCIVFIGLAHLLILIALLSNSSREPFTQFPTDILRLLDVGDGDGVAYADVHIPKLEKRHTHTVCKAYDPSDIIQADRIIPTLSDTIHLRSSLNVNGILDVDALKIKNKNFLRYDEEDNSFVFG